MPDVLRVYDPGRAAAYNEDEQNSDATGDASAYDDADDDDDDEDGQHENPGRALDSTLMYSLFTTSC